MKRNQELFYDGKFKKFLYHGFGQLSIKNYYTYVGNFRFNKKNGHGKINFVSG